ASMSMDLNDLNKVWEIKPLNNKVRQDEAKLILEKVAKQVQPIMRNRKWKVNLLSEFCPSNPALLGLNVNGGQEVKLRLRRQNNEKECEELMAKGITGSGQGFDLRGKRLGGYSRQPPLSLLRQKALSAAENRVQRGTLLPSGPKRLGGDSSMREVLSPIQAAAMAAERRLHDDLWCSSQVEELPETSKASASQELSSREALPSKLASSHGEGEPKASWECGVCTLLNEALALTCEACGIQRIIEEKNAKKTNTNTKIWSCKFYDGICEDGHVTGEDRRPSIR
nr:DNA-dependent metalloprotease WSS1-like [Tanacetum cinerariifolium]